MKNRVFMISKRVGLFVIAITSLMALSFITITYFAAAKFHEESTQLLNREMAAHIAKFSSPFEGKKINKIKADSVFFDAMVLNPSTEVYFLNTDGKVLHYYDNGVLPKELDVPVDNIRKYIRQKGHLYIKNIDPRDPEVPKIFSAAEISGSSGTLGYIYVVLANKDYRTTSAILFNSRISIFILKSVILIFIISIGLTLWYWSQVNKRFKEVFTVLQKFESGDYEARIPQKKADDLEPVTTSFNKMADLLVSSLKRVARSDNERKDLLVNISHDLRTPLSVAKGYAETLLLHQKEQTLTNEKQENYLQLIFSQIKQTEKMVLQLFELAKMESASFELNAEPFVLAEIIQETVTKLSSIAAEKQLTIDCNRCTEYSWVSGDISMMERVIQNLLTNAIAYTPPGECIILSLERVADRLIFQISNRAEPLGKELLNWLNSPAAAIEKRPVKSSIGLSIVKKILQLHEFDFGVEIRDKNENFFIITMPTESFH